MALSVLPCSAPTPSGLGGPSGFVAVCVDAAMGIVLLPQAGRGHRTTPSVADRRQSAFPVDNYDVKDTSHLSLSAAHRPFQELREQRWSRVIRHGGAGASYRPGLHGLRPGRRAGGRPRTILAAPPGQACSPVWSTRDRGAWMPTATSIAVVVGAARPPCGIGGKSGIGDVGGDGWVGTSYPQALRAWWATSARPDVSSYDVPTDLLRVVRPAATRSGRVFGACRGDRVTCPWPRERRPSGRGDRRRVVRHP